LAESRAALHAASKLNPYESLGLASHVSNAVVGPWPTYFPKNLEEGGGVEPLPITQYLGVQTLFVAKDGTFHLVGVVRIELTTSRLKAGCSNQLSAVGTTTHLKMARLEGLLGTSLCLTSSRRPLAVQNCS